MKNKFFFVFGILALISLSMIVFAVPQIPIQIFGTVDKDIPDGTPITIEIDGVVVAESVIYNHQFGYDPIITIGREDTSTPAKDGYSDGDELDLFIIGVQAAEFSYIEDEPSDVQIDDATYVEIQSAIAEANRAETPQRAYQSSGIFKLLNETAEPAPEEEQASVNQAVPVSNANTNVPTGQSYATQTTPKTTSTTAESAVAISSLDNGRISLGDLLSFILLSLVIVSLLFYSGRYLLKMKTKPTPVIQTTYVQQPQQYAAQKTVQTQNVNAANFQNALRHREQTKAMFEQISQQTTSDDQKIRGYVAKMRALKYNDQFIMQQLLNVGWSMDLIQRNM